MRNKIHVTVAKPGLGMIGPDQNLVTWRQVNFPFLSHRPPFGFLKGQDAFPALGIDSLHALRVGADDLETVSPLPDVFEALDESDDLSGLIFREVASLAGSPLQVIHDLHWNVFAPAEAHFRGETGVPPGRCDLSPPMSVPTTRADFPSLRTRNNSSGDSLCAFRLILQFGHPALFP